ncbi:MAG: hypothetical protein ACKOWX_08130 [Flavobacteriales bacterium]
MRVTLPIFLLVFLLFESAVAQTSKNFFTYGLTVGANRPQTEILFGDQKFTEQIQPTTGFNFQYTRMVHPKVPLNFTAGFGLMGVKLSAPANGSFLGDELSPFSWGTFTLTNLRLEVGSGYELLQKKRSTFSVLGGIGIRKINNGSYGSMSSEPQGELYRVEFETAKPSVPFMSLGAQWSYQLKTNNYFSLKLSYDHSFANIYDGTYALYNQTSSGTYNNQGRFLNLQIAYTLNGQNKAARLALLQQQQQLDRKAAKKVYRKEKRYIDPKSMFLRTSGGIYLSRTQITNDPNKVMNSGSVPDFMPQLAFEKGIGNNLYLEASLSSGSIWFTEKYTTMPYSSMATSTSTQLQLGLGAMYRWTLPSNYVILNFHAGLSSGLLFDKVGNTWSSSSQWGGAMNNTPFEFSTQVSSKVVSKYLGAIYLGASKDFRLANRVYLNLGYRRYFGFNTLISSTIQHTDLLTQQTSVVQAKVKGGGSDIVLGLKFKLNK